jgi:hypothetical protein
MTVCTLISVLKQGFVFYIYIYIYNVMVQTSTLVLLPTHSAIQWVLGFIVISRG